MLRRASFHFAALIASASLGCSDDPAVPVELVVTVENVAAADALTSADGTSHPVAIAPGAWAVHERGARVLFEPGEPASPELETLAEEGDPRPLATRIGARDDVHDRGAFSKLDGSTYEQSPILPGETVTFTIEVVEGQRLSLASMFGQSNDVFVAGVDIDPLPGGEPAGDVTAELAYFDAGTEVNEEPGTGASQAPRQTAPNTGTAEGGVVAELEGGVDAAGYTFPPLAGILRVRIERP